MSDTEFITVLGVNLRLRTALILNLGRKYCCPIREKNDGIEFQFKNQWRSVADYATGDTKITFVPPMD